MENLEEKVNKLDAIQEINDCLTRYCRAMDWVDEDLLKTCFLESGYIFQQIMRFGVITFGVLLGFDGNG